MYILSILTPSLTRDYFKVGFAEKDITPSSGMEMPGDYGKNYNNGTVHDPIKAVGTGGRKVRNDEGNIWDHFNVIFTYPEDVHVSFNSIQYKEHFWDVGGRYFGDVSVAEAALFNDTCWSVAV